MAKTFQYSWLLWSLEEEQLSKFSSWIESIFGYGISVQKTGGHISINIEKNGLSVNVVDTGYGISQILPVLAQIWWGQRGHNLGPFSSHSRGQVLAVEQPELHLHPAHQALLADSFVKALESSDRSGDSPACFLIETHSEALVNRLGQLIENKKISATDVQIVIFDEKSDGKANDGITLASFNEDGTLTNWPFGFFDFGD